MHQGIDSLDQGSDVQFFCVGIGRDEFNPVEPGQCPGRFHPACNGPDLTTAREQGRDQMTADKPGGAGH
ncbi:hypothetical protein CFII68_21028 [Pseudomonas sp. CFII68]|nr:hypothetical protein CFII68_21028 [Pseudomonas sp. CFII68]